MTQLALDLWGDEDEEPSFDWADPDLYSEQIEHALWYNTAADPYQRWPDPRPSELTFWLGSHRPNWLYPGSRKRKPAGPLFVSARQLAHARKSAYPPCDVSFAVDSGGYSELFMHGRWTVSAADYAAQVQSLSEQTGTLQWAAIQDWMVEPWIIEGGPPPWGGKPAKGTGFDVLEHQRRTVASYLELRELAPEIRWLPVIQGQTVEHYLEHVDMYASAGVCLRAHELVGVGSVCRRQSDSDIAEVLGALAGAGLRLHGFGVKLRGLARASEHLDSADSLAWSKRAKMAARHGEPGAKSSDANCIHYAERWRARLLSVVASDALQQPPGNVDGIARVEHTPADRSLHGPG